MVLLIEKVDRIFKMEFFTVKRFENSQLYTSIPKKVDIHIDLTTTVKCKFICN